MYRPYPPLPYQSSLRVRNITKPITTNAPTDPMSNAYDSAFNSVYNSTYETITTNPMYQLLFHAGNKDRE